MAKYYNPKTGEVSDTPPQSTKTSQTGSVDTIREAIRMQAIRDPENASTYKQLYDMYKPEDTGGSGVSSENLQLFNALKPSSGQETSAPVAEMGLDAIKQLKETMRKPSKEKVKAIWRLGEVGKLLGGEDVGSYQNAAYTAFDVLTRQMTGAALNMTEQDFYKMFVPTFGDSPRNEKEKLDKLEKLYWQRLQTGRNPTEILSGGLPAYLQTQSQQSGFAPTQETTYQKPSSWTGR